MVKPRKNCGVYTAFIYNTICIIHPNILYGLSDGSYFKQTMMPRAIMSESLWPNIIFAMAYRNTKP